MTPEQKRIADRIIKLLALASSSTFASEATTARQMAEQLMQAHHIAAPESGKLPQDTIERRLHMPFAKGMRWELIIGCALADLCWVYLVFDLIYMEPPEDRRPVPDSRYAFQLTGTIGNLDMLDYMLREISRQRVAAWMNYKMQQKPDSFNKFCFGFAKALKNKIDSMGLDTAARYEHRQKLRDWYVENYGNVESQDISMGRASSEAGLAAGKDASLHRGALNQPFKQIGKK